MRAEFLLKALNKLVMLIILLFMVVLLLNLPKSIKYGSAMDPEIANKGMRVGNVILMIDGNQLKTGVTDYLKTLSSGTLGKNRRNRDVGEQIAVATKRTLTLLSLSLVISLVLGVLKGIYDSKKSKRNSKDLKLLSTVFFLSIPDIFTIIVLQSLAVWLSKQGIKWFPVIANESALSLVFPIVGLSLIPMNYISRITAVSIESIYSKPYVTTAIGKGASKIRTLWVHVFRNAIVEILGAFSSIAAMIFSSILLVEYMFSYPGLAYTMFAYFTDTNVVIAAAIVFALLFYIIDLLFSSVKYMLTPIK